MLMIQANGGEVQLPPFNSDDEDVNDQANSPS